MFTGTVVSSVLEPLEAVDEVVEDLLPGLRGQVVEIGKDSTHLLLLPDHNQNIKVLK